MRILADTNAFLWFIIDSPRLSARAKHLLESPDNERLLSMASLWEIAIKYSLGKLMLQKPLAQLLPEQLALNRFVLLDVALPHVLRVATLPFHHRDPFDRLLVAQCLSDHLPLVSSDEPLDAYGVTRLW